MLMAAWEKIVAMSSIKRCGIIAWLLCIAKDAII